MVVVCLSGVRVYVWSFFVCVYVCATGPVYPSVFALSLLVGSTGSMRCALVSFVVPPAALATELWQATPPCINGCEPYCKNECIRPFVTRREVARPVEGALDLL